MSCLFRYTFNRPELKQWSCGFVGIDSHRHSADARRLGWIDLTIKTTTNSRQTSHIYYIHNVTKQICHFHLSNEENSQNKRANLDSNSTSSAVATCSFAVTIKSLYKLALHKICLCTQTIIITIIIYFAGNYKFYYNNILFHIVATSIIVCGAS